MNSTFANTLRYAIRRLGQWRCQFHRGSVMWQDLTEDIKLTRGVLQGKHSYLPPRAVTMVKKELISARDELTEIINAL